MTSEGTAGGIRSRLERTVANDLRELMTESDWIARSFAEHNKLSTNEFRALLFVVLAESDGVRLTAGDLRKQMGLSGAAITYLVNRMTESGYFRRDTDPKDRRKVILRYGDRGREVTHRFFVRLRQHHDVTMSHLSDADLEAAHRTFVAMVAGIRSFRDDPLSDV